MLAMPITSAGIGFIGSALLLILIWFAMCMSALLMVRVYDFNPPSDGFDTLTSKYLGSWGNKLTAFCLLFLIYGLTAAYMSGGGTVLANYIRAWFHIEVDERWTILVFSLLFGGIVSIGTRYTDLFTRVLFAFKLIFLFLLVYFLTPHIKLQNILQAPLEKGLLIGAIPVIFTSFGFHGSIPSIVNYLGGNKKRIRLAFVIGSLLPLTIYLLWQWVVLGSLDQTLFMKIIREQSGLNGLIESIRQIAGSSKIELFFSYFAAAALGTSFLGVSIGLFDFYQEVLKTRKAPRKRFFSSLLTFLPPLLFALFYPEGFLLALGYAAIAGVVLALIIPVLLYHQASKVHSCRIKLPMYALLFFLLLTALTVIISQLIVTFQS